MAGKYINKLQDQRILLVGGSTGIGFAVAEAVLEFGGQVIIASRSQANVDKAVEKLKASYPDSASHVRGLAFTLGGPDTDTELQKLFDFATDNGATKLDHVVDTSGDIPAGGITIDNVTPDLILKAGEHRHVGAMMLAKFANNYLKKSYTSSFTMTTGSMAYRPRKGLGIVLASGGAKTTLVLGLAQDMAPIRVNLVSPGAIDTPLLWKFFPGGDTPQGREMGNSMSILNRIGTVEDTAEVYLAAIKSQFMTGATLHVEGGFLLT